VNSSGFRWGGQSLDQASCHCLRSKNRKPAGLEFGAALKHPVWAYVNGFSLSSLETAMKKHIAISVTALCLGLLTLSVAQAENIS
jgi:hypothetical protein